MCNCYVVVILDCSLNIKLNMLCRVGHVCAACFIEYNWAFRLLWLQCFKPYEHQFAGKVNAVYNFSNSTLCRVRKPPTGNIQKCSVRNCTNGRKCTQTHSSIEFKFWHIHKSMYVTVQLYCYHSCIVIIVVLLSQFQLITYMVGSFIVIVANIEIHL